MSFSSESILESKIKLPDKKVGRWVIVLNAYGSEWKETMSISVYKKPKWFHIKMMNFLLGIKYESLS